MPIKTKFRICLVGTCVPDHNRTCRGPTRRTMGLRMLVPSTGLAMMPNHTWVSGILRGPTVPHDRIQELEAAYLVVHRAACPS